MSKQFWAVMIAIIVILGGIFFISGKHDGGSKSSSGSSNQPTSHVEGSASSGVKLVEYGDYECPYCSQFYPVVKQVAAQYNDKIQFQFRNLPLTQIHKNAFAGARAAEAASLQGKFWQMHDKLYDNQDPNGASGWVVSNDPLNEFFTGFASSVGLNVSQFKTDFASSQVNNAINADIAAFKKTGLDESTPTFFLDGKQIHPGYNAADFQKAIDTELKTKAQS